MTSVEYRMQNEAAFRLLLENNIDFYKSKAPAHTSADIISTDPEATEKKGLMMCSRSTVPDLGMSL
jgi:hypothetical protein